MHYQYIDGSILLTEQHWFVTEKILQFLEFFYEATVALSAVYYPTSPIIVHSILQIVTQLKMYENDSVLCDTIVAMKTKYLKYWREITFLYAFTFVLDPRGKIEAFANVLDLLSDTTWLDYTNYFVEVHS